MRERIPAGWISGRDPFSHDAQLLSLSSLGRIYIGHAYQISAGYRFAESASSLARCVISRLYRDGMRDVLSEREVDDDDEESREECDDRRKQ